MQGAPPPCRAHPRRPRNRLAWPRGSPRQRHRARQRPRAPPLPGAGHRGPDGLRGPAAAQHPAGGLGGARVRYTGQGARAPGLQRHPVPAQAAGGGRRWGPAHPARHWWVCGGLAGPAGLHCDAWGRRAAKDRGLTGPANLLPQPGGDIMHDTFSGPGPPLNHSPPPGTAPAAVISSYDSRDVVLKCLSLGASDYWIKPLRANEVRNLWTRVWWRKVGGRRGAVRRGLRGAAAGVRRRRGRRGGPAHPAASPPRPRSRAHPPEPTLPSPPSQAHALPSPAGGRRRRRARGLGPVARGLQLGGGVGGHQKVGLPPEHVCHFGGAAPGRVGAAPGRPPARCVPRAAHNPNPPHPLLQCGGAGADVQGGQRAGRCAEPHARPRQRQRQQRRTGRAAAGAGARAAHRARRLRQPERLVRERREGPCRLQHRPGQRRRHRAPQQPRCAAGR